MILKTIFVIGFIIVLLNSADGFRKIACQLSPEYCLTFKNRDLVKVQMKILETRIDQFKKTCGRIPRTDEGLRVIFDGIDSCQNWKPLTISAKLTSDPWGYLFIYEKVSEEIFTLTSLGADNKWGGQDSNQDITNTDD